MATIIDDPQGRSPYWIAVISTIENGRPKRIWRSTKIRINPLPLLKEKPQGMTEDEWQQYLKQSLTPEGKPKTKRDMRLEAEEIARSLELGIRGKNQGQIEARNLRQLLEEIEGRPVAYTSVRQALEDWISSLKGSIAPATTTKYTGIKNAFLEWLGPRADANLSSLGPKDFLEYRNQLLNEGRTPKTADLNVCKILGAPFRQAVKLGTLSKNPLANVPPLKKGRFEKGIFAPEEISRLVKAAERDWKGAILAGYFTGARLQDVCNLRWDSADLANKPATIRFRTGKTDQAITLTIHPELEDHLITCANSDDSRAFVFPTLAGTPSPALSIAFKQIMEKAGIEAGIAREKLGAKGRTISSRSWHSLRHSFNSALANQGVSQELRQKFTGHSTAEMNAVYTHHELETIRRAITSIPRLPGK
jgi:integrase